MIIIDPNRSNALFETYLGKIADIDPLGGDITSSFSGVAYQDDPTVVNMFETQDFIDLCNLTHSWYEKGYFASDAATTTATTAELLMSGNCFGTFCGLGIRRLRHSIPRITATVLTTSRSVIHWYGQAVIMHGW